MAIVSGNVSDISTGAPIENVTVVVGKEFELTDMDGTYALTVNPGTYTIKAIHREYARYIAALIVTRDSQFDIKLKKIK